MNIRLIIKVGCFLLILMGQGIQVLYAKYPPNHLDPKKKKVDPATVKFGYRADCAASRSAIDMSINNVRARLLGGGTYGGI